MATSMRIVLFSLLAASADSVDCGVTATGCSGCPCIKEHRSVIPDVACNYKWAPTGKCISIDELVSKKGMNWTMYPSTYGEKCGAHVEPAQPDCSANHVHPPVPLPPAKQADWCKRRWCYVDGCKCDTGDATKSSYFTVGVKPYDYSYVTCGDKDSYTEDKTNNKIGENNCPDTASTTSDAPPQGPLAALVALALLVPAVLMRNA